MKFKSNNISTPCSRALDNVTILWTGPGKVATKQFAKMSRKSEITVAQYDAGYLFTAMKPIGINSIEELSAVLKFLEKQHRALVIRGAPDSDEIIGRPVTRTGSGEGIDFKGNFRTPEAGRHYIEIDVDKYGLPIGLKLTSRNLQQICEHLVQLLPPEFHSASFHWQLSSSAGVFNKIRVSIHLWFWLTSPVPDTALKSWAKHVNSAAGISLIDASLFQHVQAHYTAAPIFIGMPDPFPIRSGFTTKKSGSVDLQLPSPDAAIYTLGSLGNATFKSSEGQGFDYFLGRIGDHTGGDGFHRPIVQAAASYVADKGAEGTDIKVLHSTIRQRVLNADASKHSPADIADRASDAQIRSAIDSAMRKFGNSANQRRKSRRIEGLSAHFQGDYQDVSTIQDSLDAILNSVF